MVTKQIEGGWSYDGTFVHLNPSQIRLRGGHAQVPHYKPLQRLLPTVAVVHWHHSSVTSQRRTGVRWVAHINDTWLLGLLNIVCGINQPRLCPCRFRWPPSASTGSEHRRTHKAVNVDVKTCPYRRRIFNSIFLQYVRIR
jgi:hypothetical protein